MDSRELLKFKLNELKITEFRECTSGDSLWKRNHELHVLRDFCIGSHAAGGKKDVLPSGTEESLGELLAISGNMNGLLQEFEVTKKAADYDRTARTMGAGSDLIAMFEEFITEEDPLKDVLLNGIPFVFNRLSETAYIKSAEAGYGSLFRTHGIDIYERFWKLASARPRKKESRSRVNAEEQYDESQDMGKSLEALKRILADTRMDVGTGLMLHMMFYMVLFNRELNIMSSRL